MFNVLRCPKCDHVITGQDDFINTVTERINTNLVKLKAAKKGMRQALIDENSAYLCYMKYVLHNQYVLKQTELKDTALLKEVLAYCKAKGVLDDETLGRLQNTARRKQERQAADISRKLERLYGDFGNYCSNATMPDPTAAKALKKVMKEEYR